jgi:hypothetical protein
LREILPKQKALPMTSLSIKILGLQYPERYAVRRMVTAACQEVLAGEEHARVEICEVNDPAIIGRYAFVLVLPTLVINEKAVCSGRFPSKEEIKTWLQEALRPG